MKIKRVKTIKETLKSSMNFIKLILFYSVKNRLKMQFNILLLYIPFFKLI